MECQARREIPLILPLTSQSTAVLGTRANDQAGRTAPERALAGQRSPVGNQIARPRPARSGAPPTYKGKESRGRTRGEHRDGARTRLAGRDAYQQTRIALVPG